MRRWLKAAEQLFYSGTLALSAAMMVAILLLVLAQMASRVFGVVVPGIDEFAGYAVAAGLFLGLAHTLRADGHIRVRLLVDRMPERVAVVAEAAATLFGASAAVFVAFALIDFTYESWRFKEVAHTLLPTPLWIPRAVMAFGAICFAIAFMHRLALSVRAALWPRRGSDAADLRAVPRPRHGVAP